jgi:hypothetical protein
MAEVISIKIDGVKKLSENLEKYGKELYTAIEAAAKESGTEILDTRGLRKYPPETAANNPPYPYYERGFGTRVSPTESLQTSEVLGKQFYVSSRKTTTTIGNRASYALLVVGERQRKNMARIGWRKLLDVAIDKIPEIEKIYQAWIDRALVRAGLK